MPRNQYANKDDASSNLPVGVEHRLLRNQKQHRDSSFSRPDRVHWSNIMWVPSLEEPAFRQKMARVSIPSQHEDLPSISSDLIPEIPFKKHCQRSLILGLRPKTYLKRHHFLSEILSKDRQRISGEGIKSESLLRLKGGSPQLTAVIGSVFLAMVYRCITLARKGQTDSPRTINEAVSKQPIPQKQNAVLRDQIINTDSTPNLSMDTSKLEKYRSRRQELTAISSHDCGPMKMVLVVRTDLKMSAGKVRR